MESIRTFCETNPTFAVLAVAILGDFVSGLLVALATKTVSSSVSFRGMCKKSFMLLIWAMAAAAEPMTAVINDGHPLPLGKFVAIFYIVTEIISILENAAKLGVPIPPFLRDALIKLKNADKPVPLAVPSSQAPAPVVETHVHTQRADVQITSGPSGDPSSKSSQRIVIEPEASNP